MLIVTPVNSQFINYISFRDKINISGSNLQLKFERFFSVSSLSVELKRIKIICAEITDICP